MGPSEYYRARFLRAEPQDLVTVSQGLHQRSRRWMSEQLRWKPICDLASVITAIDRNFHAVNPVSIPNG